MSNRLLQLGLHFLTEQLNYNILRKAMGLSMYNLVPRAFHPFFKGKALGTRLQHVQNLENRKTEHARKTMINKTKERKLNMLLCFSFLCHLLSGSLQIKRILQSDR